jgi:HAD superfamily hydrolase (TIGR01549 family)
MHSGKGMNQLKRFRKAGTKLLNRKFWIFDLDGTLTKAVHDFPAIRRDLEIPENEDILKYITNSKKAVRERMLSRLNEIEIELADKARPSRGCLALVDILKQQSIQTGIITRNTRANTRRSLEKMGILSSFSEPFIIGREEAPPKPDPSGIKNLLSLWNARADQTIMIGDSLYDLQAGKNAGTAAIHVDLEGTGKWQEMADLQINSLEEIVNLFSYRESSISKP